MGFRGRTSCVRLNINEGILYQEVGVNRKRLRLHIYCMSFGRWESNVINLVGAAHSILWPSLFFHLYVLEAWERSFHLERSGIAPEGEISTTSKELSWTAFWEMVLLTTEK